MKITKLLCMISAAVLFASCGAEKAVPKEKYREISIFANICFTESVDGEFYLDEDGATHFVDYHSLKDVYLCPKPNCQHAPNNTHTHTEATCSAYDLNERICLYENKLYYMTNGIEMKDNRQVFYISMNCCDIDGTNRRSISKLEGYWTSGSMEYLVGDKLYFTAACHDFNRYVEFVDGGKDQYKESGIWCYSIPDNKFELIYDGYNGSYNSTGLNGYWNDRIYFVHGEIDENNNRRSGEYAIELPTGNVIEAESGFVAVSGEYLITLENDTLVLHKDSETKIAAEGFDYSSIRSLDIINGMLFSPQNDHCFDIRTGKCRKISVPANTAVRAYIDGDYILYGFDFEMQKPIYTKVSGSELLGDEIK